MGLPTYFFEVKVWADDSKGSLLVTGHIVYDFTRTLSLMSPFQHSITVPLTAKEYAGLDKGNYYEITISRTSTRTLWANGYLQTKQVDVTRENAYVLTGASSSIHLSNFRDLGHLDMDPTIFGNVIDVLNGVAVTGTYPPRHKGILTGTGWTATWVDPDGSSAPGAGDYWRTDWATAWLNVITLAQHYNFYVREQAGSLAHNGVLEIGPLNDSSGLTIWGGDNLRADMAAAHTELADLDWPNAALAQQYGYAQISAASYNDDLAHIINLVWPLGHGSPDSGGCTLKKLVGDDPPGGSGWSSWQPYTGGRLYYVKTNSKATYLGNTYEFVASQEQDGKWAYGIVNRGPSPGSGPPPFGVNEYVLTEKQIDDPEWLLSATLGHVEYNSDPVPSFIFTVKHPLTSDTGVPDCPAPGQSVEVNYTGVVNAVKWDTDNTSDTYGQLISDGSYTYLSYPGTSDAGRIKKLKRVIEISDQWNGQDYSQTLTLGRGKWKSTHWADALAKKMEHHSIRPRSHRGSSAKKQEWHNVNFAFVGGAYEDETVDQLIMPVNSIIVSDIPDVNFFDQGHKVTFSFIVTGGAQTLDFWFCKPIDGTVLSGSSSAVYGVLRFAFASASSHCGFFSTMDGSSFTGRGTVLKCKGLDNNKRLAVGAYRATVRWHSGKFQALLDFPDSTMPTGINAEQLFAVFNDKSPQVFTTFGAIGWHLSGGSNTAAILGLSAHGHHPAIPPSQSATLPVFHGGVLYTKPVHLSGPQQGRYSSLGTPKEIGI